MMPPGLVLRVAQQLAQRGGGRGIGMRRSTSPAVASRQVAQRVDRLVGLHGRQQARRLDRVGLAQQLLEVLGLHLLEGVGGLVGAQRGQQLAGARRGAGPPAGRPARRGAGGAAPRAWS